jgi:hypothetical protein
MEDRREEEDDNLVKEVYKEIKVGAMAIEVV